jgi:glycosyltransferase involved in cell wall biosynthesis
MHTKPLSVAVDLTPLRVGGSNGGLKPAAIALLKSLGQLKNYSLVFIYLTNGPSHPEIRSFARSGDILVCVHENESFAPDNRAGVREYSIVSPPADLIRQCGADVLYCPFGDARFHVPGIPTVVGIVDLLFKDWPFSLDDAEKKHRENYVTRSLASATRVQCISRSTLRQVSQHYPHERKKLFFLYLPIHGRLPRPTDSALDAGASPYFFCPANFWRHKNHEILLLAYNIYRHRTGSNAWHLVLTGHPDARSEYLKKLAATLDMADSVHFRGYVSEQELANLYAQAGALVFPSLHEGFGIPLVESMHFGLPIIAGSVYSIPELCADACRYVDPRKPLDMAEALWQVSTDPQYAAELAATSRQRLRLFNLQPEAEKLAFELYYAAFPDQKWLSPLFPPDEIDRIILPTPAGKGRVQIDVRVKDSLEFRFSVFIGDKPYGSFMTPYHPRGISFYCYPDGMPLTLILCGNASDDGKTITDCFDRIVCKDDTQEPIVLFDNHENQCYYSVV